MEFDFAAAEKVAGICVGRKSHLLPMMRASEDEVIANLTHDLYKAHHTYDPGRVQYSTWATSVCLRRMIDYCRRQTTKKAQRVEFREEVPEYSSSRVRLSEENEKLFSEFAGVLRAEAAAESVEFRRRPRFTVSQIMAVLALRESLRLTYRGVVCWLQEARGVREVLLMERVPSFWSVWAWELRVGRPAVLALIERAKRRIAGEREVA